MKILVDDQAAHLRQIQTWWRDTSRFALIDEELASAKARAIETGEESAAKSLWCLQQVSNIQQLYIQSFTMLKAREFYPAWCELEKVEMQIGFLRPHFDTQSNELQIRCIEQAASQFQSLYPYRIFLSPELLYEELRCSICDALISLQNPCGHEKGEIYSGEMCGHVVKKFRPIASAFVESPVQKYSVPFLSDGNGGMRDQYDYSIVRYAADNLQSPFDQWSVKKTTRAIRKNSLTRTGRNEKCPCGSGLKYKKCCLSKSVLRIPHFDFEFCRKDTDVVDGSAFHQHRKAQTTTGFYYCSD